MAKLCAVALAALIGGCLLGLIVRMSLFLTAIVLLHGLTFVGPIIAQIAPWADPVYTRAALLSLGDIQLDGLAIAGMPGAALHATLPSLFADPSRAHLALVRIVVHPGSALAGRLVAASIAHAGALTVGVALVARGAGWRVRRYGVRIQPVLVLLGIAVQAQVALSILSTQPTLREIEATGISFAANALLPWLWQRGMAVTDRLATTPQPLLAASLVALALLVSYVPAGLLVAFKRRRRRVIPLASALCVVLTSAACASVLQPQSAAVTPALVSVPSVSAPDLASSASAPLPVAATEPIGMAVPVFDRWFDENLTPPQTGPSQVEVRGGNGHFEYLVNGQPQVIKGMGLNTQYSHFMSPEDRAARIDADMQQYQQLGVNTVLGWDPAEFDQVLLDSAAQHDIGVVMPFDLDPDADYTDPELREQLREQVLAWVAQYKDAPSLRMWGVGNEVLHKIVHPAWVGPQDPQRELNAEAFSDWLIETADAIHAADPNHPVTYRSAEDAFVPWIVAAIKRHPGGPRPWFVFGTNCYQDYLSQILDNWPDSGMDSAIWVSEFAPGTMAVPDRPDGFAAMWQSIRAHPDWVLGGAVYAWTRNGPEGVDRNFGLTDDGVPVDGRSLDTLTSLFHDE